MRTNTLLEQAITEYYGERCDDYHSRCTICQAWEEYDSLCGRINTVVCETVGEFLRYANYTWGEPTIEE
jgi:hypothetical protein